MRRRSASERRQKKIVTPPSGPVGGYSADSLVEEAVGKMIPTTPSADLLPEVTETPTPEKKEVKFAADVVGGYSEMPLPTPICLPPGVTAGAAAYSADIPPEICQRQGKYGQDVGFSYSADSTTFGGNYSADTFVSAPVPELPSFTQTNDKRKKKDEKDKDRLSRSSKRSPRESSKTPPGTPKSPRGASKTPPVTPEKKETPSVVKNKDWNLELQGFLQEPDSLQKWEKITNLASDFTYAARIYSILIISEVHLPDELKTVRPLNMVIFFELFFRLNLIFFRLFMSSCWFVFLIFVRAELPEEVNTLSMEFYSNLL